MALARALAIEPRVLLLDEPFGALDALVRTELRHWVKELHQQIKVTTILVTHDQDEAMEVADQLLIMHNGQDRAGRRARRNSTNGRRRSSSTGSSARRRCSRASSVRPHDLELVRPSAGRHRRDRAVGHGTRLRGASHRRPERRHHAVGPDESERIPSPQRGRRYSGVDSRTSLNLTDGAFDARFATPRSRPVAGVDGQLESCRPTRDSIVFASMSYSDTIDIESTPEKVFAIIADLPCMGQLSPENDGGEWLDGATGPRVGAKFKGDNSRSGDTWSTVAKVKVYDPPQSFVFDVSWRRWPISRWEYRVEVAPGGCRVTETWTDRRNAILRKQGDGDGFVRAEFTKDSIRETLARLKVLCESHAA